MPPVPKPPVPPEVAVMYDTKLHEHIRVNAHVSALRVIGGWIYVTKVDNQIEGNQPRPPETAFVPEIDLSEIYDV
jgi:hypothetical protein